MSYKDIKGTGGTRMHWEPSYVLQHNFLHCNEEENCSVWPAVSWDLRMQLWLILKLLLTSAGWRLYPKPDVHKTDVSWANRSKDNRKWHIPGIKQLEGIHSHLRRTKEYLSPLLHQCIYIKCVLIGSDGKKKTLWEKYIPQGNKRHKIFQWKSFEYFLLSDFRIP